MPLNILQLFHSSFFDDKELTETSEINCVKFAQWRLLMKLCMLLMAINYSNKFIVHYLISMQFRRDFWNLLIKYGFTPYGYRPRTQSVEVSCPHR